MSRIFLSHAEKDAAIMEQIAQGLKDEGYATWYFERDVLPGMSYLKQVTQAIDSCDALALIISPNALDSSQITQEVIGAFERNKPFFPVLIGITPPELKERQPEWWHALGGIAMITVGTGGIPASIERVIAGLKARGIQPEGVRAHEAVTNYTPGSAIPKHAVEKVLAARSSMEGERKQVTVLFADVVGFSSLSDKLDPEEVHDLLKKCIEFMAEEIHHFEGTISQFFGDGLMALFGAPIAHEDAPRCALYAALAIQRRLREYAGELKTKGIEFAMRIGINTGLVIVGRIGDDLTMEYTAVGDTVNMASRMESTAQPGTIQVAETTFRLTEGYFDFEDLGEIQVKGKEQSLKAYRVIRPRSSKTRCAIYPGKGLTPFVGRTKELEHLVNCFDLAKEGHGQGVGVMGEPGMGKSRLIREFVQVLPAGEYTYFEGGCLHYGEAIAYLPLLDIIKDYFDILEDDNESTIKEKIADKLAQHDSFPKTISSPLHELLSLTVKDEVYLKLEPMQRRERVFEAIRILLIAESQTKPLIVVIEDLHWIDRTSEEFLNYFIGGLATNRILLLLLYRPEYIPLWVNKTYFSQIRIDQLSQKRSIELVQRVLANGGVGQELSDFIANKTAGNPLYIEELTRSLLEKNCIKKEGNHYILFLKHSHVPDTIQGIIASRLDHLEENIKKILQMCSVIGREFSLHLLQAVAGLSEDIKSCLHKLQSLEIIYEKTLFPEVEYIFKHTLFQEVTYNSLLLKKRRELHGKVGQAIELLYHDRLPEFYETLAHHFSLSNNSQKAYEYLKLSGDKAAKNFANREAVRFYKETIRVLDTLPQTMETRQEKINLSISIMAALLILGYPKGSQDFMDETEKFAREFGDEKNLAEVYCMLGNYYALTGNPKRGSEYAEKSFYAAEKIGDIGMMARTANQVCDARFWLGDCEKAVDIARRILPLLEKHQREKELFLFTGGFNVYSSISAWCGVALGELGYFEEGIAILEKGFQNAFEIRDMFEMGLTQSFLSVVTSTKGDAENTADHAKNSIKFWEEGQSGAASGGAVAQLGLASYLQGDYETAINLCEKGLKMQKDLGVPIALPWCYWCLGLAYLATGDLEKARKCAEEALEISHVSKAKALEGISWELLGMVMGKKNPARIDEAQRQIFKGISISEERKLKPYAAMGYLFSGELFADVGQGEEALESLKKTVALYQEMGCEARHYWLARALKALARIEVRT